MLNICKLKEFGKFIIFSMTSRCAILPMLNPNTYTYTILSTVVYIHVKKKKKKNWPMSLIVVCMQGKTKKKTQKTLNPLKQTEIPDNTYKLSLKFIRAESSSKFFWILFDVRLPSNGK